MCRKGLILLLAALLGLGDGYMSTVGWRIVDMSHTLDSNSIKYPINPEFKFTILNRGIGPGGFWFEINQFDTPEHIGTHMDGPSHFSKDNWRVHQIPVERLVGPGVVIDIRHKVALNPDYRLSITDLRGWERIYGRIPDGAIVFMWSGWDVRYPNKSLTFNTNTPDDLTTWHFPGFHPSAMTWLVQNRNISMVGVDTPSIDYAQSSLFESHQIMCGAQKMGLENVNNIGLIPENDALIVALPVKLLDGSGGPVRIIALFKENKRPCQYGYC